MSTNESALAVAQRYIGFVEARDKVSIAHLLDDNVRQIFPMAAGGYEGLQAVFEGKDEVLQYTYGLFEKFSLLAWPKPDWTGSDDGTRAFLQAKGDAIVAHSKAHYRNTYVVRFDVLDGRIVQMTEYANADLYMALGIEPREGEIRAVERAMALSS
jgi:ketosteroid isomerase-like protein